MAGYTKEFLMNAFLSRYESLGEAKLEWMAQMASDFYDEVGKDNFRKYCSLDAAAIKLYKESLGGVVKLATTSGLSPDASA